MELLNNSPKRLKIYIRASLKSKEFDALSNKRKKYAAKKMKIACRRRWLRLHAGVDAAFEEYEGVVISLQKIKSDKAPDPVATGLLKMIKHQEFLESLYMLKHILSNISHGSVLGPILL